MYSDLPFLRSRLLVVEWRESLVSARSHTTEMRGNGFKLEDGKFKLNIRKKFFVERVVRP